MLGCRQIFAPAAFNTLEGHLVHTSVGGAFQVAPSLTTASYAISVHSLLVMAPVWCPLHVSSVSQVVDYDLACRSVTQSTSLSTCMKGHE